MRASSMPQLDLFSGCVPALPAECYSSQGDTYWLPQVNEVIADSEIAKIVLMAAWTGDAWVGGYQVALWPNGFLEVMHDKDWGLDKRPHPEPDPVSGERYHASYVTYGNAPGYRDITLQVEIDGDPARQLAIELNFNAEDSARIAQDILHVHKCALLINYLAEKGDTKPILFFLFMQLLIYNINNDLSIPFLKE